MRPSPAVALSEPLVRAGCHITVHETTKLPDGRESQRIVVTLPDGKKMCADVRFATKEEL